MIVNVIAVTGKAGVGKDLTYSIIKSLEDTSTVINIKFAAAVVATTSALYDIPESDLKTQEGKKAIYNPWNATGRELLQYVGTDLVRNNMSKDHWVAVVQARLADLESYDESYTVVFTDCRFKNEVDIIEIRALDSTPFLHLQILRPINPLTKDVPFHESELYTPVFPEGLITYSVVNDGNKAGLALKVKGYLARSRLRL